MVYMCTKVIFFCTKVILWTQMYLLYASGPMITWFTITLFLSKSAKMISIRKKPERGHDGPRPVTAKCCRALLLSDNMNVNYIATSTFLTIYRPFFKTEDNKLIFDLYNHIIYSATFSQSKSCSNST